MSVARKLSAEKKQVHDSFKAFYDFCVSKNLVHPEMELRMADLTRLISSKSAISNNDEYVAWKNISDTITACIDLVTQRADNFPVYQELFNDPAFDKLKKASSQTLDILRQLYPFHLSHLINHIFDNANEKHEPAIVLRTAILSVIQNDNEHWSNKNKAIIKLIRDYCQNHENKITSIFKNVTLGSSLREYMMKENATIQFFYISVSIESEPDLKPPRKSSINP